MDCLTDKRRIISTLCKSSNKDAHPLPVGSGVWWALCLGRACGRINPMHWWRPATGHWPNTPVPTVIQSAALVAVTGWCVQGQRHWFYVWLGCFSSGVDTGFASNITTQMTAYSFFIHHSTPHASPYCTHPNHHCPFHVFVLSFSGPPSVNLVLSGRIRT